MTTAVFRTKNSLPGRTVLQRDKYLNGTTSGAHGFDVSRAWCFGRQAAPVTGDAIKDFANDSVDGSVIVGADPIGFTGGALDFTGVKTVVAGVVVPGDLTAIAVAQQFLFIGYYKLPAAADWVRNSLGTLAAEGSARFVHILGSSVVPANVADEVNLIQIVLVSPYAGSPNRQMWVRRGSANGHTAFATILYYSTEAEIPFGQWVQFGIWRSAASGFVVRLKSAAGAVTKTGAFGAASTASLAGTRLLMGRTGVPTDPTQGVPYRVVRGWLENLSTTGRDPVTVLDADWARRVFT